MRALFVGLLVLLPLLAPGPVTGAGKGQPAVDVVVDAGRDLGPFPYVLRTGVYALAFSRHPEYPLRKLVSENLMGGYRHSLGLEYLPHQTDEKRFYVALDRKLAWMGREFRRVREVGGTPWLDLGMMPRWLSRDPNLRKSDHVYWRNAPPSSYERWSELVRYVVDDLNNRQGLDVWYSVWSEPNVNHWQASIDEFVKLYRASVVGARSADPKAVIGGPAVVGWRSPHELAPRGRAFMREFLERAGRTPVKVGSRRHRSLPLDFVDIHSLAGELPGEYPGIVRTVRRWLKDAGYPRKTPFAIGEWVLTESGTNEVGAAYAGATLIAWSDLPNIELHSYTSLFDQTSDWTVGLFEASFDTLRTNPYIARATYNVFRAFSRLGGHGTGVEPRRVAVQDDRDSMLYAVATHAKTTRTTRVILVNFAPTAGSMQRAIRDRVAGSELRLVAGPLRQCWQQWRRGDREGARKCSARAVETIPDRNQRDAARATLEEIEASIRLAMQRQRQPVKVELSLRDLGFEGAARVTSYRIDRDHSNYAAVKGTPRGDGLRETVRAARATAEREALLEAQRALGKAGYSKQQRRQIGEQLLRPVLDLTAKTDARFLTPDQARARLERKVRGVVKSSEEAARVTRDTLKVARTVLLPTFRKLYYRGSFKSMNGRTVRIDRPVDHVNRDASIDLDGSMSRREVRVSARGDRRMTVKLEPYSVHLIEIEPAR